MMTTPKAVNLPDRYIRMVQFARFCKEHGLDPTDLARLLLLADRAFKAGERECNTGKSADGARTRFEEAAKAAGFGTEWNGLGPTLKRDKRDVYLPDC